MRRECRPERRRKPPEGIEAFFAPWEAPSGGKRNRYAILCYAIRWNVPPAWRGLANTGADRQHLEYLEFIEKFHCSYCAYGTGLIAYISEVIARTEQYFCPIKHARKIRRTHARSARFLEYGDAQDYEAKLEQYRVALGKER